MISEEPVAVASADGVTLEGRLAVGLGTSAGMVICHPHPLYGGDMENPVVVRVVEVAGGHGLTTLRFNFRGVGRSTGAHGGGEAERADVGAALRHLQSRLQSPDAPIVLAGYSFGAAVAARVAVTVTLAGLVLIAPPLALAEYERFELLDSFTAPLLVIAGTNDEYCPLPALDRARAQLPQAAVRIIDGANHFFFGTLFPLGEAVREWLEQLQLGQSGRRGSPG